MPDDLIETRNARGNEARKIDEWSVRLPGGKKAKFDVTMKYEHGLCVFILKSTHPDFQDISLMDSDLNALKAKLDIHVKSVISDKLSTNWMPSTLIEITHRTHNANRLNEDIRFSLSLRMRRVELLNEKPQGNFPSATVRDAFSQETLALRSHSDDFSALKPKSGSLRDPEVLSYLSHTASRDGEKEFGRLVVAGDGAREQIFLEAVERFATQLSDRLTQSRIDLQGFPGPADLIEIARQAAESGYPCP